MNPELDSKTLDQVSDNETSSESVDTSTEKELSPDIDLKLKSLLEKEMEGLRNYINESLNGIATKFKKEAKKPDTDSGGATPVGSSNTAVEALQNELQQLRDEINRKEIEQANEKIKYEVKEKIGRHLDSKNYDGLDEVKKIFFALYPPESFKFEENVLIYSGTSGSPKTFDSIFKEFHSTLGKRFLKPESLTDGTGKGDSESKDISSTDYAAIKSNPIALKQAIKQGKFKLSS